MDSITNIPKQALPLSEKDQEWREQTVEAYINQANFKLGVNSYRQWLLKLYDYYNGKIDSSDYSYVLEPYGKRRDNFPAQIRNYNIIKPSIDLLIGEKAKRPFNWNVIVTSPDVVTIKEYEKNEAVKQNLYQWFVNRLNDAGFQTGMQSEEVQLPEEIEQTFERNWKDQRAIMAQQALNYLIPYLRWYNKTQKGWKDFLISGYAFSIRDINNNEPKYEILNPLDVDFDKDPDTDFVEDGNWAVVRQLVSRNSVIDYFRKQLTDEQIERLESPRNTNGDNNQDEQIFHDGWDSYTELVTVYWKSIRKIGFRTYQDEFGEILEEVVDEDYEFNPETDIDVEWDWINEVWKGYRIDGDMYLEIEPYPHQRSSIDNPSKCKLPVNGRAYSDRNSSNISLVELGIPYQLSYNIYKYRLENAIAKSKDILAMMDINLIPEGWNMDKFLYFVEATGIAWVNYQKEGVQFNPQHQGVMDLSIKTIDQYVNLLRFIKEEWEYLSGITRQRMGEMSPYEGKATSQQAIVQSSHITEDYFRKYAEMEERDLQAIVDYSQLAWIEGKKGAYITNNGLQEYLDIDPDTYTHAEFGVFVKDASVEQEKLNQLKMLGQSMVQNGAPISVIADIIDSDNFIEIKDRINKAERMMQQLEEQAQQMEQQMRESEMQEKQEERAFEAEQNQLDRENKIDVELIKQQLKQEGNEDLVQSLEEFKAHMDVQLEKRKIDETVRSNKANERLKEKEINVKKQQAKSKTSK